MKNELKREKTSQVTSIVDDKKLFENDDLDPKISLNLIDSIMDHEKDLRKNKFKKSYENIKNETKSERIVRSLESKKHDINKKIVVDVILNRLLTEKKKSPQEWSTYDFELKERSALKESLNNFKTLSMMMGKASSKHILNRTYLKDRITDQLKKQETDEAILIDKEEIKRLTNLKEEFMESLKKNQKDYDDYQSEITQRNAQIQKLRFDICNCRKMISDQSSQVLKLNIL